MSFTKSHLKAAREYIGKKDYLNARKEAIQVLEYEPDNYNASVAILSLSFPAADLQDSHVFLGLSLLELGEFEDSEQVNSLFSLKPN